MIKIGCVSIQGFKIDKKKAKKQAKKVGSAGAGLFSIVKAGTKGAYDGMADTFNALAEEGEKAQAKKKAAIKKCEFCGKDGKTYKDVGALCTSCYRKYQEKVAAKKHA